MIVLPSRNLVSLIFSMMGVLHALGLICLCAVVLGNESDYVPVLVWGSKSLQIDQPSLKRLSMDDFYSQVLMKINGPGVFFVQDSLSLEDLNLPDKHGPLFPSLRLMAKQALFLPQVAFPYDAIDLSPDRNILEYNQAMKSADLNTSLVMVPLASTVNQDRAGVLRNNDRDIERIYVELKEKFGDVTAIFSGRTSHYINDDLPQLKRTVREVHYEIEEDYEIEDHVASNITDSFYADENNTVLFYAKGKPVIFIGTTNVTLGNYSHVTGGIADGKAHLHVTFDKDIEDFHSITLKFNFIMNNHTKYWSMSDTEIAFTSDDVDLNENVTYVGGSMVTAPLTFSYHCYQNVILKPNNKTEGLLHNSSVLLVAVQVQPFNVTHGKFSDGWDCVTFFTIGILTTLFVTAIMGIILLWAIYMIASVKTNDLFDDPKGKVLVIPGVD